MKIKRHVVKYQNLIIRNCPYDSKKEVEYQEVLKIIQNFYEKYFLPNKDLYKHLFLREKHNQRYFYTVEFYELKNITKYTIPTDMSPIEEIKEFKDFIYKQIYFSAKHEMAKEIAVFLMNFEDDLSEISQKSKLIREKIIRGKLYYEVLDANIINIKNELANLGFSQKNQKSKIESANDNGIVPIEKSKEKLTSIKKPISSSEPIGSTIPYKKEAIISNKKSKVKVISGDYTPEKQNVTVQVSKRRINLVSFLKNLYDNKCQLCGEKVEVGFEEYMSEVHHIRPLGKHKGADAIENMIVVCPNHHVMFDRGAIMVNYDEMRVFHMNKTNNTDGRKITIKHSIDRENIEYHNRNIYKK